MWDIKLRACKSSYKGGLWPEVNKHGRLRPFSLIDLINMQVN
jgi:hypothetical protein